MFWKNAKTLKYEYIQRERDVVRLATPSENLCYREYVYVCVAMMEAALGVAAHFSALFPSFPLLYRTQNGTLRGLFKLMSGGRYVPCISIEIRVNVPLTVV